MRGRALLGLALLLPLLTVPAALPRWPPAYDPFMPLDLDAPPNLLLGFKLARLRREPQACRQALATGSQAVAHLPDRRSAEGCVLEDTVRVDGASLDLRPGGFVASCPLAAGWALLERQVLQTAARELLGAPVQAVQHLGSFACRNVYGRENARRSEHASANAVDLAGFVLADGRRISILHDWGRAGSPEAAFLRRVRDGACRYFAVVLGPDHNAAHRDHLHLDQGFYRACR